MATDTPKRGCRLPGCEGPSSGVCINNLSFDECPDVIELDEDVEITARPSESSAANVVTLPGGRSLDVAGCDALLRERGGLVFGLVADPDVGKTTLIATIYELLHRRRFASFSFRGSETLRGYEERSHLSRISSEASRADTKRTPVSVGVNFTHLSIASGEQSRDVVFSDRSGEHFETALARPATLADFPELNRADAIIFLVDLLRLKKDTHVTVSAVRRLFMGLDQTGLLEGKAVLIVGTKADLALPPSKSGKASVELARLVQELNKRAAGRFVVRSHLIACHARAGSTVIGEGVEELLTDLMSVHRPAPAFKDESWPPQPNELDQLMRSYRSMHA